MESNELLGSIESTESTEYDIEAIREMWKDYNKDYCSSCIYSLLNHARKNGYFCKDNEHFTDDDVELLVCAGKDIARLFEILDNLDNNTDTLSDVDDTMEIKKRWENYDQIYCGSCLYDRLNYGRKNGYLSLCHPKYIKSEDIEWMINAGIIKYHLDDDDVDILVYAGQHINILLDEIINKK